LTAQNQNGSASCVERALVWAVLSFTEMPLEKDDRLRVAIHEAGHAVVAHSLGIPVLSMSVRPSKYSRGRTELPRPMFRHLGRVRPGKPLGPSSQARIERWIMVMIAAGLAEAIHYKDTEAVVELADAAAVDSFLKRISLIQADRLALREDLGRRTIALLQERMTLVERLAVELVTRRRLTASEVGAIVPLSKRGRGPRGNLSHSNSGTGSTSPSITCAGNA